MEVISLNSEALFEDEGNDIVVSTNCDRTGSDDHHDVEHGRKEPVPPCVGMEFDSYDAAYDFYNCYSKEVGFGTRVRCSWFNKKNREKCGAVLCCSKEGFKQKCDTTRPRVDTRTGCPALLRLRLMDSGKWRVTDVGLEHNHLLSPANILLYRSHKNFGAGVKRKSQLDYEGIQTNNFYQVLPLDVLGYENIPLDERGALNCTDPSIRLKLKEGDAQALSSFFCRMQLMIPNFFYLMDHNNEGHLRNVFWADARSRTAYRYFGEVVAVDTTCLTSNYEIPLVSFLGVNHHGQLVLLGCGLLASETVQSFFWLFKAWVTFISGRPPLAIVTDQCEAMQRAVDLVFPTSHHHLSVCHIMQKVPEKLKELGEYEEIKHALSRAVYDSLRVHEFEYAWEDMIRNFAISDHQWLQVLYEDRRRWVPVYVQDTLLAGLSSTKRSERMDAYFDGYLRRQTPLKEFLDNYEIALEKKHDKEAKADYESLHLTPVLKTKCSFELQLSKFYTREIFKKFQHEVEAIVSCFNTTQVHADVSIITYIVKERVEGEDSCRREVRDYEVLYNTAEEEVHCICNWFNFKGYLCRHALTVLNYNGVEEIPSQYILSRWRKDFKHQYIQDHGSENVDVNNPVEWYRHLNTCALQIIDKGLTSQEHFKVALQALDESLNKVHCMNC